jgi:hypothetical protein
MKEEHSREYFEALTAAYLSDPTHENAQRLWEAAFRLDGWFIILRGEPSNPMPYFGIADGRSFVAIWTDASALNDYIDQTNMQPVAGEDIQYMMIPLPAVVEYILGFEKMGLDGIRFNPPLGWAVPFGTLRAVAGLFGMLSAGGAEEG